jgi:hypothetical protein
LASSTRAPISLSVSIATLHTACTMLARRLLHPSSQPSLLVRSFTTSCVSRDPPRSPSLADISHDGAEAFNAKQKAFRDNLQAAKEKKAKEDSQFLTVTTPASSAPDAPTGATTSSQPPDPANLLDTLGLGSLYTHRSVGEAREQEHESSTKRKGPFSNLIYGTPEGRQMDKEIERSFSQVLARGKYVHSIVFHSVKPEKVDEYVELVGSWYPRMAKMEENKVNLVGSWRTEVGDCETFGLGSGGYSLVRSQH